MQKEVNSGNSVPLYLFHQGTNMKAYEYMGLRKAADKDKTGMTCRVWAPNAQAVSLVGDFNEWDETKHPLEKISENGVWEAYLPFELEQYSVYKFCIIQQDGAKVLKSDPYAYHFETRPNNSSIYCDIEGYELVVMTEMRPLLERHHPTVLIETGGDNRPRIVALFGSIGYDGYVLSEGTMRPLADGDTKDIVFVHRSRRERYQKLIRP